MPQAFFSGCAQIRGGSRAYLGWSLEPGLEALPAQVKLEIHKKIQQMETYHRVVAAS